MKEDKIWKTSDKQFQRTFKVKYCLKQQTSHLCF